MSELQNRTDEKSAIETVAVVNEEILKDAAAVMEQKNENPADYRYVRHGDGPCNCCGPYSE